MDVVRIHLNDIKNIPLLTREEEVELAKRIQAGSPRKKIKGIFNNPLQGMTPDARTACHTLIYHNLRLIPYVLKSHLGKDNHLRFEDLSQEGIFGLYCAARRFDPKRKIKFSTYAIPWIRNFVIRSSRRESSIIHIPFSANSGPHSEKALAANREMLSLSDNSFDPAHLGESLLYQDCSPEPQVSQEIVDLLLDHVIKLPTRTAHIIICRFGLGGRKKLSLDQLGVIHGITKERVRQIETEGLTKIRKQILSSGQKLEFA